MLIFHEGLDLPYVAAVDLLKDQSGQATLRRYYSSHASIARNSDCGFILHSAPWRASADWGARLGYSEGDMAEAKRQSIPLLVPLRRLLVSERSPMVIHACCGQLRARSRGGDATTLGRGQGYPT